MISLEHANIITRTNFLNNFFPEMLSFLASLKKYSTKDHKDQTLFSSKLLITLNPASFMLMGLALTNQSVSPFVNISKNMGSISVPLTSQGVEEAKDNTQLTESESRTISTQFLTISITPRSTSIIFCGVDQWVQWLLS